MWLREGKRKKEKTLNLPADLHQLWQQWTLPKSYSHVAQRCTKFRGSSEDPNHYKTEQTGFGGQDLSAINTALHFPAL
jgi:hypothetical protein